MKKGLLFLGLILSAAPAFAWQAALTSIEKKDAYSIYTVTFSTDDGRVDRIVPFSASSAPELIRAVKNQIRAYASVDADNTMSGPIDLTDPVVTPPNPTQEEIDRENWIKDYNNFLRYKKLLDLGIWTPASDPVINTVFTNTKARVHDNFKAAYLIYIFP